MRGASCNWPAVTGLGAITPFGPDLGSLWAGVWAGESRLSAGKDLGDPAQPPGWVAAVQTPLSHEGPRALAMAAHAAQAALDDAGWDRARRAEPEAALVVATTKADLGSAQAFLRGQGAADQLPQALLFALAPALAQALGWGGSVHTVSVACASGLAAVEHARQLILRGAASRALVVGVDALSDFVYRGFTALRALDPQGARPFDAHRAGLSLGEGAVAVVLEPDRPGRAQLAGYGASNDAHHITGPAKDARGLVRAMQDALQDGHGRLALAVAHGTGTVYNDAMEGLAYARMLPQVPVTGVKGAVGHMMGAAGLMNLAVAVQALQTGTCPPVSRLETVDPRIELDLVQGASRRVDGDEALVSASGFAGVNAALCLCRGSGPRPVKAAPVRRAWVSASVDLEPSRPTWAAQLGAKTARRLDDLCLFGLAAVDALLLQAGLPPGALQGGRHGLVLGTALGCLESDLEFYTGAHKTQGPPSNPRIFAYTLPNIVLGEVAIRHGLMGENLVVSAGRVSGLSALIEAAGRVQSGAWTRAVVLMVEAAGPGASALQSPPVARASAVLLEAQPKLRRVYVEGEAVPSVLAPGPSSTQRQTMGAGGWSQLLAAVCEGEDQDLEASYDEGYAVRVRVRTA